MTLVISRKVPTGPELFSMLLDHMEIKNIYINLDKEIQDELKISIPDVDFIFDPDMEFRNDSGDMVYMNSATKHHLAVYRLGGIVLLSHVLNAHPQVNPEAIRAMVHNLNSHDICHEILDTRIPDEAVCDQDNQELHNGCITRSIPTTDGDKHSYKTIFNSDPWQNSFWAVRVYLRAQELKMIILYLKVLIATVIELSQTSLEILESIVDGPNCGNLQVICKEILTACDHQKPFGDNVDSGTNRKTDPEHCENFWQKTSDMLIKICTNDIDPISTAAINYIELGDYNDGDYDDTGEYSLRGHLQGVFLELYEGLYVIIRNYLCSLFDMVELEYTHHLSIYECIDATHKKLHEIIMENEKLDKENKVQYAEPILKFIETGLLDKKEISIKDISDNFDILMDIIGGKNPTVNEAEAQAATSN